MTENLVPEVREFLEGLGYDFDSDWQGVGILATFEAIDFYGSESEVLIDCLEHFLKVELGRHWMIVWHETEAEYKLEPAVSGNIASAIDYLFKLRELDKS